MRFLRPFQLLHKMNLTSKRSRRPTSSISLTLLMSFSMAARTCVAFLPQGSFPPHNALLPNNAPSHHHLFHASSTQLFAIADEVMSEMKVAMKAKDTTRLATIRLIRSAFANAAIEQKVDTLSDDAAVSVLRKMAKMRQDSIQMFTDGGALDRAEAELAELAVIESWLPTLATEDVTRGWVIEAIEEVGIDDMGKVMGSLMKKHKAEIDGSVAQKIVKEEIAKRKE